MESEQRYYAEDDYACPWYKGFGQDRDDGHYYIKCRQKGRVDPSECLECHTGSTEVEQRIREAVENG